MIKKELITGLAWYANKVAETVQYANWSDEFCRKEIKESTDNFLDFIIEHIDWDNLTVDEAIVLRFKRWYDDMPDLWLIPLYLLPILPIGTKLTTIGGTEIIYDGKNVDNDIRMGCIAYGITIKEKKND